MKTFRVPIRKWRREFFAEEPPKLIDVEKAVLAGEIPGERVGNSPFVIVYCDGEYNPVWPQGKDPKPKTGSNIADNILKKYNHA